MKGRTVREKVQLRRDSSLATTRKGKGLTDSIFRYRPSPTLEPQLRQPSPVPIPPTAPSYSSCPQLLQPHESILPTLHASGQRFGRRRRQSTCASLHHRRDSSRSRWPIRRCRRRRRRLLPPRTSDDPGEERDELLDWDGKRSLSDSGSSSC